jgi:prepilin-type N-terminal cleavage/methylation domain-containing protein
MKPYKFSIQRNFRAGFTIVELLVVLAIAGFILSIIFVSITGARARGRDARRAEDIKQIQNMLDIYHVNRRQYPVCAVGVINGSSDCLSQALIGEGIINSVAVDPLNGGNGTCLDGGSHIYCYESDNPEVYTLHYNLETDSILGRLPGWQEISP